MTHHPLPAPCHLCGHTCVSRRRGRVLRRLTRADFGHPDEHPPADVCPWRQCPHRPSGHELPPILEDQRSHGVVAPSWPPGDRHPVVLSLHPDRAAAEAEYGRLVDAALNGRAPRPRGIPRVDYDVIEFPHALLAAQLHAAQQLGYEYGCEHAMDTACERLREDGALPAATAALHHLAARHPDLFADTIRYLFGVPPDIAHAVTESVRHGYSLDAPLADALNAVEDADPAAGPAP